MTSMSMSALDSHNCERMGSEKSTHLSEFRDLHCQGQAVSTVKHIVKHIQRHCTDVCEGG